MEEIDDLLQGFLGLILTGHIRKCDSGLFFHKYLGLALADGHSAAHFAADVPHQEAEQQIDGSEGDHIGQKNLEQGRHFILNLVIEFHPVGRKTGNQLCITHQAGEQNLLFCFRQILLLFGLNQNTV